MVSEYIPKTNFLSDNRLKKYIRDALRDSAEDRKQAQEMYEYFKAMVDEAPGEESDTAKNCMVNCLKIKKELRSATVKMIELAEKMNRASKDKSPGKTISLQDLLDDVDGQDDDED